VRVGHDVLAAAAGLAAGGRVVGPAPRAAGPAERGGQDRLVPGGRRHDERPGPAGWEKTGPSPVDRSKPGTKHGLLVDGRGRVPLAVVFDGANRPDVEQLVPLVDAVPPVRGKAGRPRRRFDRVQADRGFDSEANRQAVRDRGGDPVIAKRRTPHGSGLGKYRWVVERAESWLHQNRRLKLRYDRRDDLHEAFLALACALICLNCLEDPFC